MEKKIKFNLQDICECKHSYGSHIGLKRWPEGTPIPQAGSCNSCLCKKFVLKIEKSIETTNKKECPKCDSKDILETRSWLGEGSSKPYQPIHFDKKHPFYLCKVCHSYFLYKE